jgi:hypothetical protein
VAGAGGARRCRQGLVRWQTSRSTCRGLTREISVSIALLIMNRGADPESGRLVPVATHAAFMAVWMPGASSLGLRWVPLFETGVVLESADLPDVIRELRAMHDWFVEHELDVSVVKRVDVLIDELMGLGSSVADVEISIG